MGKVAQVRTSSAGVGRYDRPSRADLERLLGLGHSVERVAAMRGASLREVRRAARRLAAS